MTTCPKVPHVGTGHLHAADDDSPYSVDGHLYCGRCHYACSASGVCENPKHAPGSPAVALPAADERLAALALNIADMRRMGGEAAMIDLGVVEALLAECAELRATLARPSIDLYAFAYGVAQQVHAACEREEGFGAGISDWSVPLRRIAREAADALAASRSTSSGTNE